MNELIEKLKEIHHPNISIKIFSPETRLSDLEKAPTLYPLSPRHFILFEMEINNGDSIFKESTKYLFIYEHIFISSSMGLEYYSRSDGATDAKGSYCYLLYEKTGLKSFELLFNKEKGYHQLALNLNDGNIFYSVRFNAAQEIPSFIIPCLNQALKINRW